MVEATCFVSGCLGGLRSDESSLRSSIYICMYDTAYGSGRMDGMMYVCTYHGHTYVYICIIGVNAYVCVYYHFTDEEQAKVIEGSWIVDDRKSH
jgi:hypothetical protein